MNVANPDDRDDEMDNDGRMEAREEPSDADLANEPDPAQAPARANRSGSNPNIINK